MKINERFSSGPAELYTRTKSKILLYQRFISLAQAIRYSMEELPSAKRGGIVVEVNEKRYDHNDLRKLYLNNAYPYSNRRKSGIPKELNQ